MMTLRPVFVATAAVAVLSVPVLLAYHVTAAIDVKITNHNNNVGR